MKDFSELLIRLRKERNLTQYQLEEVTGIPRAQIAKYEQRRSYPHFETLIRLADYFGVSLDYLAGREQYSIASFLSKTPSDAKDGVFTEMVKRLDEERRFIEVPRLDLDIFDLDPTETRWTYLPNALGYPVGYVDTHGLSISQLDKFQDAVLFVENGALETRSNEPTYVLIGLEDGTYHVAVQVEYHGSQFISTYDFVRREYNDDVRFIMRILKVEHIFV